MRNQCKNQHAGTKDAEHTDEFAWVFAIGVALHEQGGQQTRHSECVQRPVTGNERQQQDTASVLFRDKAGMADYSERYHCKPCNRVFTQAFAGEQIDTGTYGICPAYKTEDSPPTCMERFPVEVFINNQRCKQYHACYFHYGEKGFFCTFGLWIYSPCQEETDYHKDSKPGMGKTAFDAAAIK